MDNKIFALALASLLAGCATQPAGVTVDQATQFREQGISIGNVKGAASVALKTKGQAVGGMVLSTVAASLAASSPASMTPQGLQQAQETGGVAGNLVQRGMSNVSTHVRQAQTPTEEMVAALTRSLTADGVRSDNAAYRIDIKQDTWLLSYDSMFGSDNYRLHWQLKTSVLDSTNKVVATSICQGDGDTKQALDTWKANDYAQVKEIARKVGDTCAQQLLNDIGLHG